jgi:hypothetical protein
MVLRQIGTSGVAVAICAVACGGSADRSGGAKGGEAAALSTFDCHEYGTSAAFEGLDPDTRNHLHAVCEMELEFEQYASARRSCRVAADCVAVKTSCPFGCAVAVATSSRADVLAKYEEIRQRVHAEGVHCSEACESMPEIACVEGLCRLDAP